MACSKCKKKENISLSKAKFNKSNLNFNIGDDREREFVFEGRAGKIVYFIVLLVIAITPIPNLVALYFFYLAVFGGTKKKKEEKNVEISKDTNNS